MLTKRQEVLNLIYEFVNDKKAFTALDVSNKIKQTYPYLRHKEVRDVVINEFASNPNFADDYMRTPIDVFLADGSTVTAILYHHFDDKDNLDTVYPETQRTQKSNYATQTMAPAASNTANINTNTATNTTPLPSQAQPILSPKDVWTKLFSHNTFIPNK